MTVNEILAKCFEHVSKNCYEWPEDDWVELDPNWDANVWTDGKIPAISVYPVVNGYVRTDVDSIRIF